MASPMGRVAATAAGSHAGRAERGWEHQGTMYQGYRLLRGTKAQQSCAWDYTPISSWKLRAATALKMPAILRHDSPTSNARSWAPLCSPSPGERDPGTSQQPFLSAHAVRAGTPNEGTCLKPRSPRGSLFQSPEQQVFSPVCAKPHMACSRGGTWTPLPPPPGRDLGAQAGPGACFLKRTSL